jgi:DNA-binding winged helix-turn-helix (wHTH) protein
MNSRVQQRYEFGPFQLDTANHSLLRNGQLVPLTPKAFDLLEVLVENNGRLIEKDELLKEVWPDSFVEEGNINRNISIIRKVLGEDATGKPYIETVPKRGYRFVASVKTTNGNGAGHLVELAGQNSEDNDLNTASLIPSHPHPAFGHPGAVKKSNRGDRDSSRF